MATIKQAYAGTVSNPNNPEKWHPSMREVRAEGKKAKKKSKSTVQKSPFKIKLDGLSASARDAEIEKVVTAFRTTPKRTIQLVMGAGDKIGLAAGSDHRLVFYMIDTCGQYINPLTYLHRFTHAGSKIVVLTTLTNHPLIVAYPELIAAAAPRPRVAIQTPGGLQDQFVLGDLQKIQSRPTSKVKWKYLDNGELRIDGTTPAEPGRRR